MEYLLFCADASTPSGKMPDLSRLVPVKFDSLGEAINAACKLISAGAVVWQIKGAEGFMMERGDIELEFWRRRDAKPDRIGNVA